MSDNDQNSSDKTMITAPSVKRGPPPKAKLVCVDPAILGGGYGREVTLDGREITFGRGDDNTVTLAVPGVSRSHARFYPGDAVWGVEDLGSTNGVMVNKTKVAQAWLTPGDIVSIGKVHYKYSLVEGDMARPAAHSVDISESDRTLVLGTRPAAAAAAVDPTAKTERDIEATEPLRAAPRTATPASAGGGNAVWIVVVVAVVAIAAAAYFVI